MDQGGSGSLMRLWSRRQPGLQSFGTGGSISMLAGGVVSQPLSLAGCGLVASVPVHLRPSKGCVRVLRVLQLASTKANAREKNNIFVTSFQKWHTRFRYILFFRTQSLSPAYTLGGELSSTSRRQGNERICRPIFKTLNSFKNYKNKATIGPCSLTPEHVFPEKNMVQKDTHTPIFINYCLQ